MGGGSRGGWSKLLGNISAKIGEEEKYVHRDTTEEFLQMMMMEAITNGQSEQLFLI